MLILILFDSFSIPNEDMKIKQLTFVCFV